MMRLNPDPMEQNEDSNRLDELVESYAAEYTSINSAMDEIDSYMNHLEQTADSLYAQLKLMLEDNRSARLSTACSASDSTTPSCCDSTTPSCCTVNERDFAAALNNLDVSGSSTVLASLHNDSTTELTESSAQASECSTTQSDQQHSNQESNDDSRSDGTTSQ